MGGQDAAPWSEEYRQETYRALGSYEASRAEADAVFQDLAAQSGVSWSIVNPASVIGDSAAHRFGDAPAGDRRFTKLGGIRTFEVGKAGAPTVVLPGLPVNADTWAPVVTAVGHARAVDLPGLGMSAGRREDWQSWLTALVTETGARHLVGHSIGAAAAVDAATAHHDAVDQLTLVSPFFLQGHPPRTARRPALTRWYLRRKPPKRWPSG
ncbi:alpha/beta fold hydrolase [Streptomyces sp. NPDC102437]|uniref:alpha/beta fold hydrolase n=1 Tax=Streptomyces sp. NPDC102437 TaxID=3366175 RepID=UPI00382ABF74